MSIVRYLLVGIVVTMVAAGMSAVHALEFFGARSGVSQYSQGNANVRFTEARPAAMGGGFNPSTQAVVVPRVCRAPRRKINAARFPR